MRISKSVRWQICWAALFAVLFVVATHDVIDKAALVWLVGLTFAALVELHKPRMGGVAFVVLIHVAVGGAVIAMATAAPVKTKDRLLAQHLTLPKAAMQAASNTLWFTQGSSILHF